MQQHQWWYQGLLPPLGNLQYDHSPDHHHHGDHHQEYDVDSDDDDDDDYQETDSDDEFDDHESLVWFTRFYS